ncbi:MAG: tRNA 2-selenouridine(34) synthase MnmH [Chitinophagaceae bacterium]|nr:tRNA 2-selenouridine(34) synthase MnmH [Chitinophagaceae bacterium]
MVQKLNIDAFLQQSTGHPVIDVRAPGEFLHAHIPGAISLPLFSDEERAVIGTIYKQKGREEAMLKALDYYGANMQRIISDLKKTTDDKKLFVHCWRGGMRSGVVSWMLDLFGYQVSTLNKGYKVFRAAVLESFSQTRRLVILGGKTGSAKTMVIHELIRQQQQVIDLEGLACHKGSAFGGLNEPESPSQEQFENDLFMKLRKTDASLPIWLEDESQRIGPVNLPNALWAQMRNAQVIYLEIPFEERLNYLVQTYGEYEQEELKAATLRIRKRLGGLETNKVIQHLESKDMKSAFNILLHYYDKNYLRATKNRDETMIQKIDSSTVDASANAQLILQALKNRWINSSKV